MDEEHEIQRVNVILEDIILNLDQSCKKIPFRKKTSLHWENLADASLAKGSYVQSIQDGVMIIACKHSVYLQLLRMQKRGILQKLRKHYASLAIVDIRGVIDTITTEVSLPVEKASENEESKSENDTDREALFHQIMARFRLLGEE
ncbi:DUF721 domain-containing protein [Entomospira entomophila]|uniref:DUF721 domain-containing protein n=1 Tax=Entomospira entomophila TaxID=2719988 RepID=A0A968G894_9SPIO|nr:DUF721 domain-containing protein [Entomospira entomophilus]NIZ40383.1 DUF721 domain-containing protein [Entomospira entomophilus]WDI35942.1 DUF721 domain-containing protein [Entomospira entomophilus]